MLATAAPAAFAMTSDAPVASAITAPVGLVVTLVAAPVVLAAMAMAAPAVLAGMYAAAPAATAGAATVAATAGVSDVAHGWYCLLEGLVSDLAVWW